MKRVLLDTGVLISAIDREDVPERMQRAQELISYLRLHKFQIFYSQRTERELLVTNVEARKRFLETLSLAKYYIGYETWDQISGTWENIGSTWNQEGGEMELSIQLKSWLKRERDLKDRGILLDAIFNGCTMFVHENPKDFGKIPSDFLNEFKINCVNLLELDVFQFQSELM